ncbi:MAG: RtcB family protein [Pirellulaceae bacterium]|nr:RtcB family protein [Pirellulaceae bacterium]
MILNRLADVLELQLNIQVDQNSYLDCPHNFAQTESHSGQQLIVHRKSANWAPADCRGLIAGSMATGTLIVVGRGKPDSLCSSAHGAGRAMSRTEAAQRIEHRQLTGLMSDITYRQDWANLLRDEAPQAYKDLRLVMQAQHDLVRIERHLKPILNDKRP